jgi:hypothetical protein
VNVFPQNFEVRFIRTRNGYWRSVLVFGKQVVELGYDGPLLARCLSKISHRTGLGIPKAGDTSDLPTRESEWPS